MSSPEAEHLEVEGLTAEEIGTIALAERVALFELTESHSTLEEAYMHLTREEAEFLIPRNWPGRERPMTTTTFTVTAPAGGRQGVLDVCRAEWLRVRSSRASKLFALFIVVVPLFWCYETASSTAPISSTMGGLYASQVLIGIWATLFFTGEYSTGSIRTTVVIAPRRLRLFVSKCLVAAVVMTMAMEAAAISSFVFGKMLLRSSHPPLRLGLSSPAVMHVLVAVGIYAALLAVLCVSLGALIRFTAGAALVVATITSAIYSLYIFGHGWRLVARFSPVGVFRGQISSSSHWSSLVVMGLISLVVAATGYTFFARRDA